jgi:hypothetical protein
MFQAKFYTLINYMNTGRILPFYFYVFASNSNKAKTVKVEISEPALMEFRSTVEWLIESIESDDFKAVPSFDRCRACTIEPCGFRRMIPDIIEVSI